ncbi:MAG: hypothetical protein N2036_13200 [Bryobacteraceae bacterium]|nr:hypothetical protein [Bryobacteraceae bacterium]
MKSAILFALPAALALAQPLRVGVFPQESRTEFTTAQGLPSNDVRRVWIDARSGVRALTAAGAARFDGARWIPEAAEPPPAHIARGPDGTVAEARAEGLFLRRRGRAAERLFPSDGRRSWAVRDVRGVAFDAHGRLWFCSPQGAGALEEGQWKLYTPAEGLPYDDFTAIAAGGDGAVWFGTKIGAIRFDGQHWAYRQGRRWLPHDEVRSIAVEADGTAWIATAGGISRIARKPMTLREKARFFEEEIDRRHRRTPYEFVHPVIVARPGDASAWTQTDSDNDGLWTAMYGAGECFAYAATGDEAARRRARKAFEALRFLSQVTQGGTHPAPRGFVARSILPASGPDPNLRDSPERDRRRQAADRLWKVIIPRWPLSADGQWYWKSDTSSDELDGHFFFYGAYYDHAARTEEEKREVREHVAALADHLLAHNYTLVDHDGRPTRWAVFSPDELNHNRDWWQERGINSLSILSYLRTAHHITGDARYERAYRALTERHGYAMNAMIVKSHQGPGGGNQSDDEMIFMNYYNLIRYETDPDLKMKYLLGFRHHFENEMPEMNPLFHFLYAAAGLGAHFEDAFGRVDLSPPPGWLEDAADTLKRIPLDRFDWAHRNSHRKDIVRLPAHLRTDGQRAYGMRNNGKVLPADERYFSHWNHDPWQLDTGGEGRILGDGAVFLLPYYLGLHHRFLAE